MFESSSVHLVDSLPFLPKAPPIDQRKLSKPQTEAGKYESMVGLLGVPRFVVHSRVLGVFPPWLLPAWPNWINRGEVHFESTVLAEFLPWFMKFSQQKVLIVDTITLLNR